MKKTWSISLLVALLVFVQPVSAQEETPALSLRMTRDFGYGGFDNEIEGLFSLIAEGPEDLIRVDFHIDDQQIATDDEPPFRYQFSTKDYAPGQHRLAAVGFTSLGEELHSNEITRVFLSPAEAQQKVKELVLPLLVVFGAVVALTAGLPLLFGRKKPELGKYGLSGGAVCPKCGLPFPIHFFSFHAGAKNLERCPHCAKWVWVRRAKPQDLVEAEALWRGDETAQTGRGGENKRLREQIDDSRYENNARRN